MAWANYTVTSWLRQGWEYVRFGMAFFVLRQDKPYVLGLVTNDTCNLHCVHCHVANVDHVNMPYFQIQTILTQNYKKGVRFLYLEGGEPYLWRDGDYRLKDVVRLAHEIGYLRVHIYTNGTVKMDAAPDYTWISIDGLGDVYRTIRGISLEHVLNNIRTYKGRWGIVYTVNTINYRHIGEFLTFIHRELPGIRVMFYFHTPYYGIDSLLLSKVQRVEAINMIFESKRAKLPVMNSFAGLKAMASGEYLHPTNLWRVIDSTGEYQCCRAFGNPDVCENCGYSTCAEITLARNWRMGPISKLMRAY
jgi:MoaA/NifB/PqqE/SkfB family radical SAM enzyme